MWWGRRNFGSIVCGFRVGVFWMNNKKISYTYVYFKHISYTNVLFGGVSYTKKNIVFFAQISTVSYTKKNNFYKKILFLVYLTEEICAKITKIANIFFGVANPFKKHIGVANPSKKHIGVANLFQLHNYFLYL